MASLYWRLHANPIATTSMPLYLDLSARYDFRTAFFTTNIAGGLTEGQIEIENPSEADALDARKWFMKWIRASDASGQIAYEGLVTGLRVQTGYHNYKREIDKFANLVFQKYHWSGSYVGVGKCPRGQTCKGVAVATETAYATTRTTQEWGLKEAWLEPQSNSVISPTQALNQARTELTKTLQAHTVEKRPGDDDAVLEDLPRPAILLSLSGAYATLGWRMQTRKYKTDTDIATIVQGALTGKSEYLSTDYSQIATVGNSIQYNANGEYQWVKDYIAGAIAPGDTNQRELFFQIWEDRRAYLTPRGVGIDYYSRSDDPRTYGTNRGTIRDYMVRAGGLLLAENADIGVDNYSDNLNRPYVTLLESTKYDDVNGKLSWNQTGVEVTAVRLLAKLRQDYRGEI